MVVDSSERPFPAAYELLDAGVPWWAVLRWSLLRMMLSRDGLAEALEERRN